MTAVPPEFIERIKVQFPSQADEFIAALDWAANSSIRLNAAKPGALFSDSTRIAWNDEGNMLSTRPKYTLDPKLHAGCYYPQESSSMALQWVLQHCVGDAAEIDALDLCAAPGGKSLTIADFLRTRGRLVSNEIIKSRAHVLREVLTKWGSTNVIVTNNRPVDFGSGSFQFDLMVVDAPCSGEGMFRKDPDARAQWTAQSTIACSDRQKIILGDVLHALREHGVLIYSTCTFAPEENEDVVRALVQSGEYESLRWPVPTEWNVNVLDDAGVFAMRFLPHQSPGEGFFIAALRKVSRSDTRRAKPKSVFSGPTLADRKVLLANSLDPDRMVNAPDGELYQSPFNVHELNTLAANLYVQQPGVHIGRIVRDELIPGHAMALAQDIAWQASPIELDLQQANAYLRGEAIAVQAVSGWQRVAFEACVLGWVKVIGNRVNNYYPKEWRVKMKE